MAVYDASSDKHLTDCWFAAELNRAMGALTSGEISALEAWINEHVFDAAKASPRHRMNVTHALRNNIADNPDWAGTPLAPLYDKTGQDFDRARKLYGNFVCRVGVAREESWWCFPEEVGGDHASRTYVLPERILAPN